MLSCILLTAGLNERFGSPKALAKINEGIVIEHLQGTLLATPIDEIIIVLGAHATEIKPFLLNHKRVKVVYNKDYNFGQTSSFKVGLDHLSQKTKGVMLLPVDFPAIKSRTIETLHEKFLSHRPMILIPTYNGQKGHPPVFSISLKKEFHQLNNSVGINTISRQHTQETEFLSIQDPGVLATFNTVDEFDKIKKMII